MIGRFIIFAIFWSGLIISANALPFDMVVIDAGHGGKDGGCAWNGLI